MSIPSVPTYADLLHKIKELEEELKKGELIQLKGPKYEAEFGKLGEVWDDEQMDVVGQDGTDGLHYIDYGAGPREVHSIVNEKEYWAKLKELPDDI